MVRILPLFRLCLLSVLAGGIILPAVRLQADENAGGYATPGEAWDAYQQAVDAEDFNKMFECLTPGAQEEHLEKCVLGGLLLFAQLNEAEEIPEEFQQIRDRLQKTMQSYGVDPVQVREEFESAHQKARQAEVDLSEEAGRQLLLGRLKGDRKKFFSDVMGIVAGVHRWILAEYQAAPDAKAESQDAEKSDATGEDPKVQVLGVKIIGDRAYMLLQCRLPESTILMNGSLRVRHITETKHFRRIDGRWFVASEENEPVEAPLYGVKEADLPYEHEFQLDCGDAIRIQLPDGKEVAFWCRGTPTVGQAMGNGDLSITWGEKPFRSLPSKYRNLPNGARVSAGDDSYIQTGIVATSSNRPGWCRRDLCAGNYYILTEESNGKEGKLALKIQIRPATQSELLHGDARREHYVKQLQSDSPAERKEAIKQLDEIVLTEMTLGDDPAPIAEAIHPLLEDPDADVAKAALDLLCICGDEQTLLGLMTPTPKESFRSMSGGYRIARWNLKQDHESVIRRAVTFFDSEDPKLVEFAVGFFTRVDNPIAKEQILAAVDHPSAEIRAAVVGSLRFYCEPEEAARLLATRLDDDNEDVIRAALRAAGRFNQDIEAKKITPKLKHPDDGIRWMACCALAGCRDPEAVAPLLEATRDESPLVRGQAAITLAGTGSPDAVDRLIEMLNDPVADVRADAVSGLRQFDSPQVIPAFERLLETEKDARVRRMVERTLEER